MIFWVVRGVKGQKIVQNDKKLCPLPSIFQEPYIMGLLFMVHVCKMIISPSTFFSFLKFWFSGPLRGWRSKRARYSPKSENIMYVTLHISGAIHHMILHLLYTSVKWWGLQLWLLLVFFHFFKILVFQVVRGA